MEHPRYSKHLIAHRGKTAHRGYNYDTTEDFESQWDSLCNANATGYQGISLNSLSFSTSAAAQNEGKTRDAHGGGLSVNAGDALRGNAINSNLSAYQGAGFHQPKVNLLTQFQPTAPSQHTTELYTRFGENQNALASMDMAPHGQLLSTTTPISRHYLGDPSLKANQSANIPDEFNTSVWITNLPPHTDHKMLLDSIRNCGKVYAAVINRPDHNHTTAASKVVFFDVAGVDNLLHQARMGGFAVGGYMPHVCRNRIKTEAKAPGPQSRVLHIEGPTIIVNKDYLTALFHSDGITWQTEEILLLYSSEHLTRLEWRFGSYRCQAESARHVIERVKKRAPVTQEDLLWKSVTVHFGIDPCARMPGE
ncbi:hypothetical protein F4861DRAFT_503795 [Xylaria intraflava]|nr:hypothetical protein F4861DRAFT_503795 [Xylaria intraflava]